MLEEMLIDVLEDRRARLRGINARDKLGLRLRNRRKKNASQKSILPRQLNTLEHAEHTNWYPAGSEACASLDACYAF